MSRSFFLRLGHFEKFTKADRVVQKVFSVFFFFSYSLIIKINIAMESSSKQQEELLKSEMVGLHMVSLPYPISFC